MSINKIRSGYICLLLIVCLPMISHGQDDIGGFSQQQYHFRNIGLEDGLPSSAINDVIQRKDKFVWVATKNGLAKYLGHAFKTYRYEPDNSYSLGGNDVTVLFEDREERLWVGTDTGLYLFNDDQEQFHRITTSPQHPKSVILHIAQLADGSMSVGTENGLSLLSKDGEFIRSFSSVNISLIANEDVKFSTQDQLGQIWFATKNGLYIVTGEEVRRVSLTQSGFKLSRERFFDGLVRDNVLWLATDGSGVIQIDMRTEKITSQWTTKNSNLKSNRIWSLKEHENKLAIAYFYDGVSVYYFDKNKFDHMRHQPKISYSLPYDEVSSVYFEENGLLWVGTTDGLAITHPNNRDILHVGQYQGLDNQHVWSVALADEKIWLGHEDGIAYLDIKTKKINNLVEENKKLNNTIVWQMKYDAINQRLWLGTNLGVFFVDKDQKIQNVQFSQPKNNKDEFLPVYAMHRQDDQLYIAYAADFHQIINLKNFKSTMISENEVLTNVSNVESYKGGWLIANRRELKVPNKVDQDINWINQWIKDNGIEISTIYRQENQIWIGSRRNGVYIFSQKNKDVTHIDFADYEFNLASSQVQSIVKASSGNIWVTTTSRLYKIENETLSVQKLTSNFHWLKMEFNQNGASALSDGRIIFTGNRGMVLFDEKLRGQWQFEPKVALTQVSIMGENRYSVARQQTSIEIYPEETFYRFVFSSLDHLAPSQVQFKYRLLPVDTAWNELADNGELTLTRLPYGEYEIEVIGSNSDGIWSEKAVNVSLNILAPWWWNGYAQIIYAWILLSILIWFVRVNSSRLREADYAATHDTLTKLPNRLMLKKYLVSAIERAYKGQIKIAVLFLDLNKFKPINDTYGHKVGDDVLVTFANRLQSAVRNDDIVARLSGDEFVIVVTSHYTDLDVEHVVDRISRSLIKPFTQGSVSIQLQASIGICIYKGDSPRPKVSALINHADEAMYQCKKSRKTYVIFE